MFTITCTLKFKDGKSVTGRVSAELRYDARPVVYSGDVEKLPRRIDTATPALLRLVFRTLASETGAEFSFVTEGQYDIAE